MPRHYHIVTLGCPKNAVDSRQLSAYLSGEGYEHTEDPARADVIVVNTCGFIEDAKAESVEAVLEAAKWKEAGSCEYLIMAGCLAQKYSRELAQELPEVDAYLGTGDIAGLPALLNTLGSVKCFDAVKTLNSLETKKKDFTLIRVTEPNNYLYNENLPLTPEATGHYAYLKIAEGCDNRCSYCVIPSIRGDYRSRRLDDIVKEAVVLTENGVRELILVAQDTTNYGADIYDGKLMLPQLLAELVRIADLKWLRLLYSYPKHITPQLLKLIANEEKICSYLDIPLQHISDHILKAMGRPIGQKETRRILAEIKSVIPGVTLRTTFIVGFPGESEADFEELLTFVREMQFDRAGFFAYSPQPDTKAAVLPKQVPEEIKQYRLDRIASVQAEIMAAKLARQVNTVLAVIADGPCEEAEGLWEGRTAGDAPEIDGIVCFKPFPKTRPGDIINVRITHSIDFSLLGEICHESGQ